MFTASQDCACTNVIPTHRRDATQTQPYTLYSSPTGTSHEQCLPTSRVRSPRFRHQNTRYLTLKSLQQHACLRVCQMTVYPLTFPSAESQPDRNRPVLHGIDACSRQKAPAAETRGMLLAVSMARPLRSTPAWRSKRLTAGLVAADG